LQSGSEKLLAWPGVESTTLDFYSQSGANDYSAAVILTYFHLVVEKWPVVVVDGGGCECGDGEELVVVAAVVS